MDSAFSLVAVTVIGLLFTASVLHKLFNFSAFTESVRGYRLFGSGLTQPVAGLLVLLELMVVFALVQADTREVGAILAILLLLLYAGGIGINLLRGRTSLHCGCSWGNGQQLIKPGQVLRNISLAVVAGIILLPGNGRELLWLDWVSVIATTVIFAFAYLAAERLTSFSVNLR